MVWPVSRHRRHVNIFYLTLQIEIIVTCVSILSGANTPPDDGHSESVRHAGNFSLHQEGLTSMGLHLHESDCHASVPN